MGSDFLDAHNRHWQDAEKLFQIERWANADHLYGVAAECGLKRLMCVFGMPFDPNKDIPQDRKDRQHANKIWARYESYRTGHNSGARYSLPATNPFLNWDISQRYADQSQFDQNHVQPHRDGAEEVRHLIHRAKLDGLI